MRRFLIFLGSAVLAIAAALVITPLLVPASAVKDELAAYVERSTGRELVIAGEGRFRIFPSTGVTFERVRLSGPEGDGETPFLRAETVTAEISLLSLISGGVRFDSLTLDNAVVDLRRNADGTANWEFSEAQAPVRIQRVIHAAAAAAAPMQLGIRQVRLRNATIRYHSPEGRVPLELTDADLDLQMPAADSAAAVTGTFSLRGRDVAVEASLDTPERLDRGESARLLAALSSDIAEARFEGEMEPDQRVDGTVTASIAQMAEVFAVAGASAAPTIEAANLTGTLRGGVDSFSLTALRVTFDNMTATGELAISMADARPALVGQLAFDALDLHAFRLQPVARDTASAIAPGLWPAHAAPPDEIRLSLTGLDALDADLSLEADTVTREALSATDAAARVRLKQGALAAELSRLRLYDGSATGAFEMSDHKGVPVVSATLDVSEVNALPLFTDASSFDWLSGKLNGRLKLASGGETLSGLRSRLQGEAEMQLRDGALEGLDLPAILSRIQDGNIDRFRRRAGEQTRFTRLNATWAIQQGVARTDDLMLDGPFVNAKGEGKVDIPREQLDLKLVSRVSPRVRDDQQAEAIELPIRMQGDWDNPMIYPDVEEVLRNPERSLGAAKNFGKAVEKLTGGEVSEDDFKNALDGLFGGKKE